MNDERLEKRRLYMREWKKNNYSKNPDTIKVINKNHYFKHRYGCSDTDKEIFGEYLGDCIKVRALLNELRNKDLTIYNTLMTSINNV